MQISFSISLCYHLVWFCFEFPRKIIPAKRHRESSTRKIRQMNKIVMHERSERMSTGSELRWAEKPGEETERRERQLITSYRWKWVTQPKERLMARQSTMQHKNPPFLLHCLWFPYIFFFVGKKTAFIIIFICNADCDKTLVACVPFHFRTQELNLEP